ncbi:type IV pilin protein [Noviherbaspirillum denitrificans]|uniref:N-terminal cleavage protein n=1 Tax=Noviherbaspirillum denitrificans TaxID=1968433 RepID=A0A254TLA8_9BURK|nr:type IV pilin protein [Noviherbaspirillum denitrificans]OWW23007.1 N-terminal cleavage protein [Noviherbaspirillum denitrificans]
MQNPKHRRGFTLIELMISMVIVTILAAVALPSYRNYVKRGKRAAAQAQMMDIANRQQQYFLDKRSYATKDELQSAGYSLPSEVSAYYSYDIAVPSSGTPAYTITFTPTGSQASDGALTLNNAGVKTPADKWK